MSDEQPKILTLAEILAADDLPTKIIAVPAWGASVKVRALSRAEVRRAYSQATDRKGIVDADSVERMMIMWGMVDPVIRPPDYDKLMAKNAGAVQQIVFAIMELSGLSQDALETAQDSFRDRSEPDV